MEEQKKRTQRAQILLRKVRFMGGALDINEGGKVPAILKTGADGRARYFLSAKASRRFRELREAGFYPYAKWAGGRICRREIFAINEAGAIAPVDMADNCARLSHRYEVKTLRGFSSSEPLRFPSDMAALEYALEEFLKDASTGCPCRARLVKYNRRTGKLDDSAPIWEASVNCPGM